MSTHQPYVPAEKSLTEFTIAAVVLDCVLGLIFAASSVYLALKAGLTVSASIPMVPVAMYVLLLAVPLYRVARRPVQ